VTDSPPLLLVEDFHKSYKETAAVTGLSFHVEAGEILGLIGRNGAGKTTTMRAVSGIIPPTRGSIKVAGFDVAKDPIQAKMRLAYVPDDPKLFQALTVWEHLQFMAAAYDVRPFERMAEDLICQFSLEEKRNTYCQELSRGMRQKVAICCALLHSPKVILFDEPLTGLDPQGIRTIKDTIKQCAKNCAAIILSSHLLILVEDLCTKYLIIDRGQKKFFGGIGAACTAFADLRADASLEDIFFRATEGEASLAEPS
jgi:ABC-2 type transport system ATP-binding protein